LGDYRIVGGIGQYERLFTIEDIQTQPTVEGQLALLGQGVTDS
jgi:hypothetical protein